jgi:hypothetical protein
MNPVPIFIFDSSKIHIDIIFPFMLMSPNIPTKIIYVSICVAYDLLSNPPNLGPV